MNFAEQTAMYLSGKGPVTMETLKTIGLPQGAPVESAFFEYRDTWQIPLTALGAIQAQTQLFGREVGSNTNRNLKLPITSDLSFVNFVILAFVDFGFNAQTTPATDAVFGPAIIQAMNRFIQATRIEISISNKKYLDSSLSSFANYEGPNIFDTLTGQAGAAPFAVANATYQQHHRTALQLDPPIIWPANSLVQINAVSNVPAWAVDTYGAAPVLTVPPWNIELQPTITFTFIGNQARVTK